ncbi:MAG: glycosyltransferase [Gemmatimonadota bacterium]
MKILYIVTAYKRHQDDVVTPWLVETIQRLRADGIDVEVLAPSYRGLRSHTVDGVRVHRFRYAPARIEDLTHDQTAPDRIRSRPAYLALVPGYVASGALAAARIVRRGRFDAVHVHWPIPHALLGFAARLVTRVPVICTFHGVGLTWTNRQLRPLKPLLRWIIRRSDAVTANSTYTSAMIRAVYDREVHRIAFGSSIDVGSETEATPSLDSGPLSLLFVGRLVARKGVRYLLDALTQARTRVPVELRVVGDGPLRESLEAHARSAGVDDIVTFEGFVDDATLRDRYRSADAFVLPAVVDEKGDTEGLGVVLIEALAHGKPAIASRTGGIVDVVKDDETGLLVEPGDTAALAEAIVRLAECPELRARLGSQGRALVRDEFSWRTVVPRLEALYRDVASKGRGRRVSRGLDGAHR